MVKSHGNHHDSEKSIKTAFFLNFFFTIVEIAGGIFTNSLAILSDALHDLGDSFSLGVSWYLEKLSKKNRTDTFSYGYRRFSLLGALISSLVLLAGSLIIITNAIPRIIQPENVNSTGMLLLAVAGIIVNGLAALRLRGGKKLNEKIVLFHLLEDVLGWAAVLIGSVMIQLFQVPVIDSVLSVLISIFILWKNLGNLLKTLKIFLQAVPVDVKTKEIEKRIMSEVKNIKSVHDVHAWSLDGQYNILTIHLVVDDRAEAGDITGIKRDCRNILKQCSIHHATIEVEKEKERCELANC
jgi:cobalt-zinc-cadmium efflux system protein